MTLLPPINYRLMYLLKSNIGKAFDIGNKVIAEKGKIILASKTKYL
jgi:hypothetical protein